MGVPLRSYDIEVWSNSGKRLADISRLVKNRRFTMQRNDYETLEGDIDLDELTRVAQKMGEHPRQLLLPLQNNLRLKQSWILADGTVEEGPYLFGAQITQSPPDLGPDERTVSLQGTGYLDLLKNRLVTASFPDTTEVTDVAVGIIEALQAVPGGDLGITIDPDQYVTGVPRERNYVRVEAKDKLQRLTNLRDGRFDFSFSADKAFRTVQALGAVRTDIVFRYGENVTQAGVAQVLPYNRIHGLGSGFGADQLVNTPGTGDNLASQAAYYMREKIVQFNSVVEQSTLDQNTQAYRDANSEIRYVPVITLTGADLPGRFLSIGDRLFLDLTANPYTDNVYGWYRLERMEVALDDNDFESEIKLYFDNQSLVEGEELGDALTLSDADPAAGILAEIAQLQRDLDEFKGRQFAGGDNIRVRLNETGNTWDVDTTIPPTAGLTWWEVVFIPDDGRPGFAQLGFDYRVTPDSGFELLTSYPSPIPGPSNQIKYIVEYSNPNLTDVNVKLKFTVRSFSTGPLSWSIVRQEP